MTVKVFTTIMVATACCARHSVPLPATKCSCNTHSSHAPADDNPSNYNTIVDILLALEWSTVTIIQGEFTAATSSAANVSIDDIVKRLHTHGVFTMSLKFNGSRSNEDVLKSAAWSGQALGQSIPLPRMGGLLLIGNFHLVLHTIRQISQGDKSSSSHPSDESRRRASLMASEWLIVSYGVDVDLLAQQLSGIQHVIIVDISRCVPLTIRVTGNGVHKQIYKGALIDLLHELSITLNFSYILQDPPDDSWGQDLGNGSWNGLIGTLIRNEADVAVAPFRMTVGRAEVTDFTSPFDFQDAYLVFRLPISTQDRNRDDFFLRPLQGQVYVALGASMLCVFVLLMLGHYCHRRMSSPTTARNTPWATWLMADIEMVVGGLLNRSVEHKVQLPSAGNVAFMTWLCISVIVVGCLYSSQLTATLTVRDVAPPFTTMEELVNQDTYTWGVCSGTAVETILATSQDKVNKQFYNGILRFARSDPDVLASSVDAQMTKVLAGNYAFLIGTPNTLSIWQSRFCGLSGIKVEYLHKPAVFYMQKNSPYTLPFSHMMRTMYETGFVTKLVQKWTPKKKNCQQQTPSSAIQLQQVKTAFYAAGIGTAISLVCFIAEVVYIQWRRNGLRSYLPCRES